MKIIYSKIFYNEINSNEKFPDYSTWGILKNWEKSLVRRGCTYVTCTMHVYPDLRVFKPRSKCSSSVTRFAVGST